MTGTVVGGKVVVEGMVLPEGSVVTVLTHGENGTFTLTTDEEDELVEAIAGIERGEYVSPEELQAALKARR